MERVPLMSVPVLSFMVVLFVGWAAFFIFGDWWWLPGAILAGIIAGDLMEAVVRSRDEKANSKIASRDEKTKSKVRGKKK